jgi:2-hydroxycyclohexanecarboxyl-CoA dehydrogenase
MSTEASNMAQAIEGAAGRPVSPVAVVTGGGAGIGRAACLRLAAEGQSVAVADLNLEAATATVELILSAGGTAAAFEADVTDPAAPGELRELVEGRLGAVGTVVNNAGWSRTEPFVDNRPELWDTLLAVNLTGTIRVSHVFVTAMVDENRPGRVINVSSDAGRVGSLGEVVYSAAKGGVISFTKALAREMARYQVTVNCVCPGPTDTALLADQSERFREAVIRAIPLRRLAHPEDVAAAIAFFAGDESSYVTGQVVSVSGGLTMSG